MAHQTPAELVIDEFGIRPLAKALEIDPTTIVRWRKDPDGVIPSKYYKALLDMPGSSLTAEELIYGGERGGDEFEAQGEGGAAADAPSEDG